jgi:hypothetical protein
MENLWSTLKLELVYRLDYVTHEQAGRETSEHIEAFYDRQRPTAAQEELFPSALETAVWQSTPVRWRSPAVFW